MKPKANIKWTPKATAIGHALLNGMKKKQIRSTFHTSYSYIQDVENSMKLGAVPPAKPTAKSNAKSYDEPVVTNTAKPTAKAKEVIATEEEEVTPSESKAASDASVSKSPAGAVNAGDSLKEIDEAKAEADKKNTETLPPSLPNQSNASLLKFVAQPITIPITSIMLNTYDYCQKELHWRTDMPWENFIDTCLVLLTRSWGIVIRGWYKPDEVKSDSPKPAQGNHDGNGSEVMDDKTEQLVNAVADKLLEKLLKGA